MKTTLCLLAAALASVALAAAPENPLGWVWGERGALLGALGLTALRLALALVLGLATGVLLAGLMRRDRQLEALLTPWVLVFLAIPWVLVMVAVNMIPSLGLREHTALGLAAAACAVQVWALGRRQLEDRRETYLRRALWYAFVAVMAAELLSHSDGLGAQLRFFTLFTQFGQLALYAGVTVLFGLAFVVFERVLLRLARKTFLWRA